MRPGRVRRYAAVARHANVEPHHGPDDVGEQQQGGHGENRGAPNSRAIRGPQTRKPLPMMEASGDTVARQDSERANVEKDSSSVTPAAAVREITRIIKRVLPLDFLCVIPSPQQRLASLTRPDVPGVALRALRTKP